MSSRGIHLALSARTRRSFTLFWAALFVLSILLQYASAIVPSSALAATVGYNPPGATTTPNEWTNPGNALASDNAYATSTANNDDQGYRNFGFNIPAGSIIDGIEVQVDAKKSTTGSNWQVEVRLSGDGGATWTARDSTGNLTTTETTYTLDGTSAAWGHVWDPVQLTDGNFRLEVRNNRSSSSGSTTTSLDQVRVKVTYSTINSGTANGALSSAVCQAADFSFVVDMSGSIGPQSGNPSNLPDLQAGITGFVNAFQGAGGDGRYAGTRFNNGGTSNLTSGFVSASTFNAAINALSGPTGDTPTSAGITAGRGNNAGDRSGVPNIMFVVTDGSPNNPGGAGSPSGWFTAANAAITAANTTRAASIPGGGNWIVRAVYLSTAGDPGDTGLPFSPAGDAQWASAVMTQIGGGSFLPGDFTSFATPLLQSIGCTGLAIDKGVSTSASGPFLSDVTTTAGTTVYYRIQVSNTGNVPLTGVTLGDSLFNTVIGAECTIPTTLAVDDSFECTYSDTAEVGTTTNVATADSDQTAPVTDSATVTVEAVPGLTIDKGVSLSETGPFNPSLTTTAGETVYYKIQVSNTGNVPLTGVTLGDTLFNTVIGNECTIPTTLAVGESFGCTYSDTAEVGTTTNVATADSDQTAPVTDSATVTVEATSQLVVEKTFGNGLHSGTANPGDTIVYTINIANNGNSAATGVDVSDDINDLLVYGSTYNAPASPPTTSYTSGVLRWDNLTVPTTGLELSFSITLGSSFPVGVTHLPNTVVVDGPDSNCAPPNDLLFAATILQDPCSTDTDVTIEPSPGSITIVKQTIPDGSNQVFTFEFEGGEARFQLSDGQSKTFSKLDPGFYTIEEINLPSGWTLTSITGEGCNAEVPGTVQLEDGDAVTCVFTNTGPETTPPPPPAPLMTIAKTNGTTGAVAPGTAVGFTLTTGVQNTTSIVNTTIVDQLPAGIGNATGISDGGVYDAGTNRITWSGLSVTNGKQLTYTATVSATATAGTYVNTATITQGPCAGNCSSSSTVTVGGPIPTQTQSVLGETATPRVTLPPTNTIDGESSSPGAGLGVILLILAGIATVLGVLTPRPSRVRRRDRRE